MWALSFERPTALEFGIYIWQALPQRRIIPGYARLPLDQSKRSLGPIIEMAWMRSKK
jgi:hypothetical protein